VRVEANGQAVSARQPITRVIKASEGKPVTIKVRRDGQDVTLLASPRKDPSSGDLVIGVKLGLVRVPVPAIEAAREAAVLPAVASVEIARNLYEVITGKQKANLSGPVGIASEMAKAADRSFVDFLQLMMFLSAYLGFFNLLPLPALDGGRALFLGFNALRIQVSEKAEAMVHMVGMLLLFGVFVLVTFNDIRQLVVRIVS
jgi:regulator of sigma E protease